MNDARLLRTICFHTAAWFALGLAAAGCAQTPATPGQLNTQKEARLAAARAITDSTLRDDALIDVATVAAKDYEVPVVEQSLAAIGDTAKRDRASASCAELLWNRGRCATALAIVGRISDVDLRNQTLAKLAKS